MLEITRKLCYFGKTIMNDRNKISYSPYKPKKSLGEDSWEDLSGVIEIPEKPKKEQERLIKIRPSLPPTSPAKFRVNGLRLLVIDSDPIKVDALAVDLRALGAKVAVGDHSVSGYTQAAKFLPDAVISDFVRPGEEGFAFIQNLRRHPLLRWSSVILLRWWEETSEDEGRVLLDDVLNQLEELLAPVRVLEERILARRPLSDRVEMTGPAVLLRVLSSAKLSGSLSVNDTWNMFTVDLSDGKITSAYRKGIDGEADEDIDAIMQLMLCDSGKWTFAEKKKEFVNRKSFDTEEIINRITKNFSRLFGRSTKDFKQLESHISVRPNFLRTASETVSSYAIDIAAEIAKGADLNRFRQFFGAKNDLFEIERIIHTLFRCGAVRFVENPTNVNRTASENASITSVVHLLKALIDNPFAPKTIRSSMPASQSPIVEVKSPSSISKPAKGAYHLQDVAPERIVPAKCRPLRLQLEKPNNSSSVASTEDKDINSETRSSTTEVVEPELLFHSSKRRKPVSSRDISSGIENDLSSKLLVESQMIAISGLLPNSQPPAHKENKHMWAAILLALILGVLFFVGIAYIVSSDRAVKTISDSQ